MPVAGGEWCPTLNIRLRAIRSHSANRLGDAGSFFFKSQMGWTRSGWCCYWRCLYFWGFLGFTKRRSCWGCDYSRMRCALEIVHLVRAKVLPESSGPGADWNLTPSWSLVSLRTTVSAQQRLCAFYQRLSASNISRTRFATSLFFPKDFLDQRFLLSAIYLGPMSASNFFDLGCRSRLKAWSSWFDGGSAPSWAHGRSRPTFIRKVGWRLGLHGIARTRGLVGCAQLVLVTSESIFRLGRKT